MNKKLNKLIGANVRRWRKKKMWTQEQLAKKLKVNRISIVNIERGIHGLTISNMIKLALLFDCTYDSLIPYDFELTNVKRICK